MAGGISKTFGALLLVVGIVAMVAGAAVIAYGMNREEDRQDDPLSPINGDNGSEDENQQIMGAGGAAAVVGLVVALLGVTFLGIGFARSRREMLRVISESRQPAGGQAPQLASPPVEGRIPETVDKRRVLLAGSVATVIIVLGLAAWVTALVDDASQDRQPPVIDAQAFEGVVRGRAAPAGLGAPTPENSVTFTVPEGTEDAWITVEWDTQDASADRLRLVVEWRATATEAWQSLGEDAGFSQLSVWAAVPPGAHLRGSVYPLSDTPVVEQSFILSVVFFGPST